MVDAINPPAEAMDNDLSVRFLDAVFGTGWGHRLFFEPPPPGSPGELLSTLFGAINAVVVAGVACVMLYTLIVAVIASAHEGTPLGRRYHTLWVPIRSVLGVALLMPLPWAKGLSVIQALILLLGWHSVAGASYLSAIALDYLRDKGNGVALEPFNSLDDVRDMATTLFPSLVAAEIFVNVDRYDLRGGHWTDEGGGVVVSEEAEPAGDWDEPGGPAGDLTVRQRGARQQRAGDGLGDDLRPVKVGEGDVFRNRPLLDALRGREEAVWATLGLSSTPTALTIAIPVPRLLGRGALGFVRIHCPAPLAGSGFADAGGGFAESFCEGQKQAVVEMIRAMLPKAAEIAARHPLWEPDAAVPPADYDPIARAVLVFQDRMAEVRIAFLDAIHARKLTYIAGVTDYIKEQGWLALGSWYWTIAGFNEATLRVVLLQPQAFAMRDAEVSAAVVNEMEPYLQAARNVAASNHGHSHAALVKAAEGPVVDLLVQSSSDHGEVEARLRGIQELLFRMYADDLFAHGDVLANLQAQGNRILSAVWSALAANNRKSQDIGGAMVEGLAARMPRGHLLSEVRDAFRAGGNGDLLSDIARFLLIPLFLLGMFLAYYIPAVPFIVWALAFLGWVVVFVEAVVAAPLWAAAHAMPEGEGFTGPQARQGYHLLLGILLRPALMVVGFFAATVMINTVAHLLLLLFRPFMEGLSKDQGMGPFAALGATVVFTGLMITIIHRVFGLVGWLPDQVTHWFGVSGHALGADAGQVRGEIGQASSQAGAAGGAFGHHRPGAMPRSAGEGAAERPRAGADDMQPGLATAAGASGSAAADRVGADDSPPDGPEPPAAGMNGTAQSGAGPDGGDGPAGTGPSTAAMSTGPDASVGSGLAQHMPGGLRSAAEGASARDDGGGPDGVGPETGRSDAPSGAGSAAPADHVPGLAAQAPAAGVHAPGAGVHAPVAAGRETARASGPGAVGVRAGAGQGGAGWMREAPAVGRGRIEPTIGALASAATGSTGSARAPFTDGDAGVNVGPGAGAVEVSAAGRTTSASGSSLPATGSGDHLRNAAIHGSSSDDGSGRDGEAAAAPARDGRDHDTL